MALGSLYIWTCTFQLLKRSSLKYAAMIEAEVSPQEPNKEPREYIDVVVPLSYSTNDDTQIQPVKSLHQGLLSKVEKEDGSFSSKIVDILHTVWEELRAPPTLGVIVGLIFGATPWLKNLVIGDDAPFRVIQDTVTILGDGVIPCITLILGGNLIQGLRKANIRVVVIITMICVRYVVLPMIGIMVVKAATSLGILPADPLFSFVLLVQYIVPPAVNINTISQLFNMGQEECSVLLMWSYLAATFALTGWLTVFLWILT